MEGELVSIYKQNNPSNLLVLLLLDAIRSAKTEYGWWSCRGCLPNQDSGYAVFVPSAFAVRDTNFAKPHAF